MSSSFKDNSHWAVTHLRGPRPGCPTDVRPIADGAMAAEDFFGAGHEGLLVAPGPTQVSQVSQVSPAFRKPWWFYGTTWKLWDFNGIIGWLMEYSWDWMEFSRDLLLYDYGLYTLSSWQAGKSPNQPRFEVSSATIFRNSMGDFPAMFDDTRGYRGYEFLIPVGWYQFQIPILEMFFPTKMLGCLWIGNNCFLIFYD